MKACGIVAEYNPFHNGHLYHLEEAKKRTKADIIIVAMSGNFLQRGEPAIIDKWERASVALKHGADIVIEIPAAYSVQPADLYAEGAVELLDAMGIDVLSFGSESGNGSEFIQAAEKYLEKESEINAVFQEEQQQKLTYAKNMSNILAEYLPEIKLDLTQPNNMLGFAYAKTLKKINSAISIETIQRKNSHYHDSSFSSADDIASATAIRKLLYSDENWSQLTELPFPAETKNRLAQSKLVHWDDYFPYLKYRILTTPLEELSQVYLMEEGLEYRVKEVVKTAVDMNDFLTRLKTRQLSWTRIQRMCFYILLNQTKEEIEKKVRSVKYVRLLGFNSIGQSYLREVKHHLKKPLITNINQKTNKLAAYDILVGDVYRLADQSKIKVQDYIRKPIKIN